VVGALAARLQEPQGPEVVVNLPLSTDGWLANNSMDAIRVRLIDRLRAADTHRRLAVYYPALADAAEPPINLHAKVMIVDDHLARVGSSNLNNRSMGLDTECDLAIESHEAQPHVAAAIRRFRGRLLGEHLNVPARRVDETLHASGSLIEAIETLRGPGRSLAPLEPKLRRVEYPLLTDTELVDPERPIDPDALLEQLVPGAETRSAGVRIFAWGLVLLASLALAGAWRFTPLGQWLDGSGLSGVFESVRGWWGTPLVMVALFVIAGFLMIPLTLLIIGSVLTFGPWVGFVYSLAGALASAVAAYGLGERLGRGHVRRLAGRRINAISRRLAARGLLTVMAVRIVPVAPFTVVNLVAGASHIRFRDYMIGTLLGMTPGMLAVVVLTDRVSASLHSPDTPNLVSLFGAVLLVGLGVYAIGRRLLHHGLADGISEASHRR